MKKFLTILALTLVCACEPAEMFAPADPLAAELIGTVRNAEGQPCLSVFHTPNAAVAALTADQRREVLEENRLNFCVAGKTPRDGVVEMYEFPDGSSHYFMTRIVE